MVESEIPPGPSELVLVWDVLPESFCGRLRSFETLVPRPPFGPILALQFSTIILDLGVLLLGGRYPCDLWFFLVERQGRAGPMPPPL